MSRFKVRFGIVIVSVLGMGATSRSVAQTQTGTIRLVR